MFDGVGGESCRLVKKLVFMFLLSGELCFGCQKKKCPCPSCSDQGRRLVKNVAMTAESFMISCKLLVYGVVATHNSVTTTAIQSIAIDENII